MTKEQIDEIRKFIDTSKPYIIYGDNERLFYGSTPGNYIIWDDVNLLCYTFRISNEPAGTKRVFDTAVIDYVNIQYMHQLVTDKTLVAQLDVLKTANLVTDELILEIKTAFNIK